MFTRLLVLCVLFTTSTVQANLPAKYETVGEQHAFCSGYIKTALMLNKPTDEQFKELTSTWYFNSTYANTVLSSNTLETIRSEAYETYKVDSTYSYASTIKACTAL